MAQEFSRRYFLRLSAGGAAVALAACAPATPAPAPAAQEPTKAAQEAVATTVPATQAPATQAPATQAPATQAPAPAAQSVDLRLWHVWGGPPHSTWLEEAIAKYTTANPEAKIETTYVGGSGYNEKVNAAIAGGDPPDVLDTTGSPKFGVRDMLIDLNPLLDVSSKIAKEDFPEYQIIRCSWGDAMYAIPREADCNALFWWNKDIYEEVGLDPEVPPTTWAELVEFSQKTTTTDANGNPTRIGYMPTYSQAWFYLFLWMTGCEIFEPNPASATTPPTVTFNAPCGELALGTMVELADVVGGAAVMSSFQQGFQADAQQPFFTGQLAMMTNGDWTFGPVKEYAPNLNFGIAPMPIPENGKIVTSSGGYGYSIPVNAQTEAAWPLIEFFTDYENSLWRAKATVKLPGRIDVAQDPFFTEDPLLAVAAQLVAEHGHGFPETPFSQMWNRVNVEMRDEAIFKQKTVPQALADASRDVEGYIKEYYDSVNA